MEYKEHDFKGEHREETLESWLESNPESIVEDGKLLIIGRQVSTNLGSFIDLLAVDRAGNSAVLELKRDRTPREAIAQALEYASFLETLDYEQLQQTLRKYTGNEGENLSEYHRAYFGLDESEAVSFNKDQRIVNHDTRQRDDSHHADNAEAVAHEQVARYCTDDTEGDGNHDDQRLGVATERDSEQDKDQKKRNDEP